MDAFTGEIRLFPYDYAPENWHLCDGSKQSARAYPALLSLLGTKFGGDGTNDFGLPDLRGQTVVSFGQAPNIGNFAFGQKYGQETVALSPTQTPTHTHTLNALMPPPNTQTGTAATPVAGQSMLSRALVTAGNAAIPAFIKPPLPTNPAPTTIGLQVAPVWGNATKGVDAHSNMMPYLAMGFFICLDGYYPVNPNN
jgi:microcystin-dependent protein